MKRLRFGLVAVAFAAGLQLPTGVAAQTRRAAPRPENASPPSSEPSAEVRIESPRRWGRPALRIGQDYTLRAGDEISEVTVIFGDATIEGRVDGNVVVVFGKAQLSTTAIIDGSLVVIGGSATAAAGALVDEDLVVVGGGFDAPAGFMPGGHHVVIGTRAIGGRLDAIVPWVTRGFLWGRPIVPDLPWVWAVVGFFFLVYLLLNTVFDYPVGACATTLAGKPLTAFVVGLLVLLLAGPVCVLLTVSVIGIAVVPFVVCALFVAAIVGRVGVARWIGMSLMPQSSEESRPQALRSFVIGFALMTLAYMVPVLGFIAWTMFGVFGLGAAALAFIAAYRRENPAPPPRVPSPDTRPPVPHVEQAAPVMQAYEPPPVDSSPPVAVIAPAMVSDLASFPHAPFRDRLIAFVLDVILVVIAQQILDLRRHNDDSMIFLLLLAYHIGFWTWKGTTVGGIICQLRVVRVDGAPLRFADALVRGLASIFSLAVLGIGGLWILRDPERQAWHDRIAGTYVVKVPRNWPI